MSPNPGMMPKMAAHPNRSPQMENPLSRMCARRRTDRWRGYARAPLPSEFGVSFPGASYRSPPPPGFKTYEDAFVLLAQPRWDRTLTGLGTPLVGDVGLGREEGVSTAVREWGMFLTSYCGSAGSNSAACFVKVFFATLLRTEFICWDWRKVLKSGDGSGVGAR